MANVVQLKSGGAIIPIVPQTIEEVFRLAQGIAASGLAPKGMNSPEQVTVAIMTGMELGLPPMFAVQKIAVINGRPSIWGDAVPALLWSRGFKIREWTEDETAHCEITRPDGEKIVRTFSDDDAKKAGLFGKSGPWQQYPSRMRQMRARGFAARDGAADVLGGLYLREELEQPMRDITPKAQIKSDTLEIPDDTDAPATQETVAEASQEVSQSIADGAGLVDKMAEDLALCSSKDDVASVADQYADLIERLAPDLKSKALRMLDEAQ